jgi:hypothetical protein
LKELSAHVALPRITDNKADCFLGDERLLALTEQANGRPADVLAVEDEDKDVEGGKDAVEAESTTRV